MATTIKRTKVSPEPPVEIKAVEPKPEPVEVKIPSAKSVDHAADERRECVKLCLNLAAQYRQDADAALASGAVPVAQAAHGAANALEKLAESIKARGMA